MTSGVDFGLELETRRTTLLSADGRVARRVIGERSDRNPLPSAPVIKTLRVASRSHATAARVCERDARPPARPRLDSEPCPVENTIEPAIPCSVHQPLSQRRVHFGRAAGVAYSRNRGVVDRARAQRVRRAPSDILARTSSTRGEGRHDAPPLRLSLSSAEKRPGSEESLGG
ncbi:unnamed protein product, partial [Iphiclides podalirius]